MSFIANLSADPVPLDAVWRASELSEAGASTVSSGHAGLDAQLPGAGWPRGHLTEVLQAQAGLHEWRLLLPALRACVEDAKATPGAPTGTIVLIGCPHAANLSALNCHGLAARAMLWVDVCQPADRLWAAEQALRCQDLAALLVWAPQARAGQLRRLQVAAHTVAASDKAHRLPPLVFVFRPWEAQRESSPAPLRAGLRLSAQGVLEVHLLKRRGPPLQAPVLLAANGPAALLTRPQVGGDRIAAFTETVVDPTDHAVDRPRAPSLPGRSLSIDQPLAA